MMNIKQILFALGTLLSFFLNPLVVRANDLPIENTKEESAPNEAKELKKKDGLKVLVLIIASNDKPAYLELQKIWKSYMNVDRAHIEAYFIRGNPDLTVPFEIKENEIIVKTEEGYKPGIINKTVLSLQAFQPRLKEFDYVLRTNLSSFYVFPRLLKFLETLPRRNCYCGLAMYIPAAWVPAYGEIPFASGSGFILSPDLAEMLVKDQEEISKYSSELPDDVLIGFIFKNKNIRITPANRTDLQNREEWIRNKDKISLDAFHFRAKMSDGIRDSTEKFDDEIFVDQELVKMFYPSDQK